jgi:putative flippase GtrA
MDTAEPVGRKQEARATGGQVVRFAFVGGVCTVLYLVLFVGFRVAVDAQLANILALLLSALANTALNRRFTFGLEGRAATREHAAGLLAFALGAGLTAVSLAVLHHVNRHPGTVLEVAVLLAATVVATVVRFVLFRWWIFADAMNSAETARDDI